MVATFFTREGLLPSAKSLFFSEEEQIWNFLFTNFQIYNACIALYLLVATERSNSLLKRKDMDRLGMDSEGKKEI